MADLSLKTAIGTYGHTEALKDHSVQPAGVVLDHVEVEPIIAAFRRMVRGNEFDVSEMAITTYLCARAFNKPFTAIPVFVVRSLPHASILVNTNSGVKAPKDLVGKRVGVRAYTVTSGVWGRGLLQSEYGVDLDSCTWVIVDEEHVQEFPLPGNVERAPAGAQLGDMLIAGEIDAGIGIGTPKADHVKPLIPDAAAAEVDWARRTGVYPINHTVVIKDEVLAANPWLPEAMFAAFRTAKQGFLDNGGMQDQRFARVHEFMEGDPLPYGIERNRKTLEAIVGYAADQHIIEKRMPVEELFAPSTVNLG